MKQTFIRILLALTLAVVCSNISSAQTAIERIVKQIEQDGSTTMTYTEQRDPNTKKVISSNRVYTLQNKQLMKSLKDAFEQERENTVRATYTNNVIVYIFPDGSKYCLSNIHTSVYTLIINSGGSTTKTGTRSDKKKHKASSSSTSSVPMSNSDNLATENFDCINTLAINE